MITFIIPVRHQDNSKNWVQLCKNLSQTASAISRQSNPAWRGVVVANHGAELPPLPIGFEVCRVDFPPNQMHEMGSGDKELLYEAFRFDKGRRVLMGMIQARDAHRDNIGHFMIVDDDDFVSCELAAFVARNSTVSGWYVKNGYVWADGGSMVYKHPTFHKVCGTSHIIRADLMELPETFQSATPEYIKTMLGSHIFIDKYLEDKGSALKELPFHGAVYRVGHAGAHSKSSGLWKTFVLRKSIMKRPVLMLQNIFRMRPVSGRIRSEFFGS